ncbi:NAD(P)/FAD-dependent oxidoreductase [Anoxynatronum sibiricum]|uniref:FAD-dependent oxidoreductase n=1 Tax=Anoxynatronum sibiricum TaxID=210623 RepID=A0ABU9VQW9_9CLOT
MELHLNMGIDRSKENVDAIPVDADVAIIGGGPAGISAAIYAKRKGLRTVVITETTGGQINDTTSVENYPGFSMISGEMLARKFYDQAHELNIPFMKNVRVKQIISGANNLKTLALSDGNTYNAKAVIIATGSRHRKLEVPGEETLAGRGVAYCAICDGPLFRDRNVVVVGGGNAAVEAAIDLSKVATKVIMVHRSQFRADQVLLDRMHLINNIQVRLETQITEIQGIEKVSGIAVRSLTKRKREVIPADGVFVEVGYLANTEFVKGLVDLNERNEIIVDHKMQTSLPGIFAAGDVAEGPFKQIVIAVGEGAKAALTANEYLNTLTNEEETNHEIA